MSKVKKMARKESYIGIKESSWACFGVYLGVTHLKMETCIFKNNSKHCVKGDISLWSAINN